jgi:hypothetical protein
VLEVPLALVDQVVGVGRAEEAIKPLVASIGLLVELWLEAKEAVVTPNDLVSPKRRKSHKMNQTPSSFITLSTRTPRSASPLFPLPSIL